MTPSLCTCSLSLSVCAMLQMCTRTPTYSSTTLHTLPVCVWLCVSAVCVCVCGYQWLAMFLWGGSLLHL